MTFMAAINQIWKCLPGLLLVLLSVNFSTLAFGKGPVEMSHSLSLVTMVPLLELEKKLIDNLENYTESVEQKLLYIRSQVAVMRAENEKGRLDPTSYLFNPLNGFSLIRRLNQDWIGWRQYMEKPVAVSQIRNMHRWMDELPTETDLWDACTGIVRIQSTYKLEIQDLTSGRFNGRQYNASMGLADIFAIGQHLVEEQKPLEAVQWLQEVLTHHQEDLVSLPAHLTVREVEVLKILAEIHLKKKNYEKALLLTDKFLHIKPHDAALLRTKNLIESQPNRGFEDNEQRKDSKEGLKFKCDKIKDKPSRLLHCSYNSNTTPFLRLAPLKMEQIGLSPYLVLYHEVLYPRELEILKSKAAGNMKIAKIHNRNPQQKRKGRTAKAFWIKEENTELNKRISRRIQDMTGLDLAESEKLQVINYGLGGHYHQHLDHFNIASGKSKGIPLRQKLALGDRIATVLFYLTDVEQGGATVFGHAGYAVYPRAGTAIFWYNLHRDGSGDPLTRHAACPVIVGSKWVMTKWIRERGQIFTRPCLPPPAGSPSKS